VKLAALALVIAVMTVAIPRAENWPQWRGPLLNGTSPDTNLPLKWSKTENVTWRLPLPAWSGSTPVIWKDRVFINVAERGDLFLWCVDRDKGTAIWKARLGGGDHRENKQNMSTPSPVTDGQHVWTMTGTGALRAFDLAGKELWARDIQKDYGPFGLQWGYASSPLLLDDALYVQVLHGMKTDAASYVLRIDKATGKTFWRVERPTRARVESPDAYTTPTLLRHNGASEIVVSGADVVTGHDLATGKEVWRADGLNPRNDSSQRVVASPIVFGEMLFVPSRERPLLAFKAIGRGDITRSSLAWSFDNGPDVPTPVTDGAYLYIVRDNGTMWCLDTQTGKPAYARQRLRPATYSGSPVLAGGRIYVTNEDGLTMVVKTGPEFQVLAENDLGEHTLSSPAISDGQIFIRTDTALYAIGKRIQPQ
jgi:outer membrane protein assembly factor BamB